MTDGLVFVRPGEPAWHEEGTDCAGYERHVHQRSRPVVVYAQAPTYGQLSDTERDLVFDDLSAILRALDLFDGARPISGHETVQTVILPAIAALKTAQ